MTRSIDTLETIVSNNLTIIGIVTGAKIGVKSPIYVTKNRIVNSMRISVYYLV
jgi:hypothetical protein